MSKKEMIALALFFGVLSVFLFSLSMKEIVAFFMFFGVPFALFLIVAVQVIVIDWIYHPNDYQKIKGLF